METTGSIGKFYVEYPFHAQVVEANDLSESSFYVAVEHNDGSGNSDFYPLAKDTSKNEYVLENLDLQNGAKVAFFKGGEKITAAIDAYHTGTPNTSVSLKNNVYTCSGNNRYSFYLQYSAGSSGSPDTCTLYIARSAPVTTSDYTYKVDVSIDGVVKHLNFKMTTGHTGDAAFHLFWKQGSTGDDVTTWPGARVANNGEVTELTTTAHNGYTLYFIIDDGNSNTNNKTDDCDYGMTFPNLFEVAYDTYYFEVGNKQYGVGWEINNVIRTYTRPVTLNVTGGLADKVVRSVAASTTTTAGTHLTDDGTEYTGYEYHNYICVSRDYAKAGMNTAVYLNFNVSSNTANPKLLDFKIMRARTADGSGGDPTGTTYPLREVVYDSPIHTQGSAAANGTLTDISYTERQTGNVTYFEGGSYIILYFSDNEGAYYALDVSIVTASPVSFNLTVKASNSDRRNEYEPGCGLGYGFYIGGLFNNVNMWDPRPATLLTNPHANDPATSEYNNAYNDRVSYYDTDTESEVHYHAPDKIDVTIERLEVAGNNDAIKLYRLDNADGVGTRQGANPTIFYVPKNVYRNYTPASGTDLGDKDLNTHLLSSGTYRLRYEGVCEYREFDPTSNSIIADKNIQEKYRFDKQTGKVVEYDASTMNGNDRYVGIVSWNAVVENLYIYRVGETANVTITLNAGTGGSVSPATVAIPWGTTFAEYVASHSSFALPTPTKADSVFGGWYTDEACTTPFDDAQKAKVRGENFTLYASWSATKYDITFEANKPAGSIDANAVGNMPADTTVAAGGSYTTPAAPTLLDYEFIGWLVNGTGDPVAAGGTINPVTSDLTLTAQWQKKKFTVTFNSAGGSAVAALTNIEYNAKATRPAAGPTKSGLHFVDWYLVTDSPNTGDTSSTPFDFANTNITSDITLKAKWNAIVSLDADGGTLSAKDGWTLGAGNTTATMVVPEGGAITAASALPDVSGKAYYTFANGWTKAGTDVTWPLTPINADTALKAKWTANNYHVTYVLDGGTNNAGNIASYTVESASYPFTLLEPTKTDNVFGGWYAQAALTDEITALDATTTSSYAVKDTSAGANANDYVITLYAKWTAGSTVTFVANKPAAASASVDGMPSPAAVPVAANTAVAKPTDPTLSGYLFAGWWTADGTNGWGAKYDFTAAVTNSFDLYARWTKLENGLFVDNLLIAAMARNGTDNKCYVRGVYLEQGWDVKLYWNGYWQGSSSGDDAMFIRENRTSKLTPNTATKGNDHIHVAQTGIFDIYFGNGYAGDDKGWWVYDWAALTDIGGIVNNNTLFAFEPYQTTNNQMNQVVVYNVQVGDTNDHRLHTVKVNFNGADVTVATINVMSGSNLYYEQDGVNINLYAGTYDFYYSYAKDANGDGPNRLYIRPANSETSNIIGTPVTITFDLDGGTSDSGELSVAKYIDGTIVLPTPHKAGYTFGGWANEDSSVTISSGATDYVVTGAQSFKAVWTAATYTLTYNAKGGSVTPASKDVTYNSTYGTLATPTREGYTFDGWSLTDGGTSYIKSADTVAITENKTIYAHWTPKSVTVQYSLNGVTGSAPANGSATYDSAIDTLATLDIPGYTFGGWYKEAACTNAITSATVVNSTNLTITGTTTLSTTLYAKLTPNNYTLTYNAKGGSVTPASATVTYNSTYGTLATPTREGYTFDGWSLTDGGTSYIKSADTVAITENKTIYAHWTGVSVTVTFKVNGGDSVSASTATVTYGSAYGTLPTALREGWSFKGWYTATEGGTKIESTTVVSNASAHDLYAQWSQDSVTVSFNTNGATTTTGSTSFTVAIGTPITVPTVEKTNYRLDKWTSDKGNTIAADATSYTAAEDEAFTAVWVEIVTVTINYNGNGTTTVVTSMDKGGDYDAPAAPTWTGYTFDGWALSGNKTGTVAAGTKVQSVTGAITFTAQWTRLAYEAGFYFRYDTNVYAKDKLTVATSDYNVYFGGANVGMYTGTAPSGTYSIVYRASTDTVGTGTSKLASQTSSGMVTYDAFKNSLATPTKARIVVAGTNVKTTPLTYRTTLDGANTSTTFGSTVNIAGDDYIFIEIDSAASVTVDGSYDFNAHSCTNDDSFTFAGGKAYLVDVANNKIFLSGGAAKTFESLGNKVVYYNGTALSKIALTTQAADKDGVVWQHSSTFAYTYASGNTAYFYVYNSGNVLRVDLNEDNVRVTNASTSFKYGIVANAKSNGTYYVDYTATNKNGVADINIGFVTTGAGDRVTSPSSDSYYAVGAFSDWKTYSNFELKQDNTQIYGLYAVNIPGVVTTGDSTTYTNGADLYKIVKGSSWYGSGGTTSGSNMSATNTIFAVDTLKNTSSALSYDTGLTIQGGSIYKGMTRVVFDKSNISTWNISATKLQYKKTSSSWPQKAMSAISGESNRSYADITDVDPTIIQVIFTQDGSDKYSLHIADVNASTNTYRYELTNGITNNATYFVEPIDTSYWLDPGDGSKWKPLVRDMAGNVIKSQTVGYLDGREISSEEYKEHTHTGSVVRREISSNNWFVIKFIDGYVTIVLDNNSDYTNVLTANATLHMYTNGGSGDYTGGTWPGKFIFKAKASATTTWKGYLLDVSSCKKSRTLVYEMIFSNNGSSQAKTLTFSSGLDCSKIYNFYLTTGNSTSSTTVW